MKNKLKKILTTTIVSAVSITAIGCSSTNTKLAKNIDKSMAEFVSSINNLDYVDTSVTTTSNDEKIGKIVETATSTNGVNNIKIINSNNGQLQFLNNEISDIEVENTITRPSERNDNFKLFVLSESPFISLTTSDNSASLNLNIKFSTNKIEETSDEISTKINTLILKRSILMIYVNEIYNGNVNLSEDDKIAINAYVNVIKENTSFFNGNRGMVKNQLSLASDLVSSESNENLINYYIIKSGEALETRANKIDSSISAIDSIIKIIEANLTPASNYYNTNLSSTYDSLISNIKSETNNTNSSTEITKDSTNKEIADKIADSLRFNESTILLNNSSSTTENSNSSTSNNSTENNNSNTNSTTENNNSTTNDNSITNNTTANDNSNTNNTTANNNSTENNQDTSTTNNTDSTIQTKSVNDNINRTNSQNNLINSRTNQNTTQRTNDVSNNLTIPNDRQRISNNHARTGFVPNTNNNDRNLRTLEENQNNINSDAANQRNINQNQNVSRNRVNRRRIRNQNRNNLTTNNENENQSQNSNSTQNGTQTTNNNLNENQNRINQQSNNGSAINTNSRRANKIKSVTNMIENKENNNDKFLRADRTPENATKEEYQSTSSNRNGQTTNDASRVPYRTNATF
jgi:hypothetical protein